MIVAHNAPFDRRVLRQAFTRIGLDWPDPPAALHGGARPLAAAAAARAEAGAARRRARDRGGRRPPRARRCADVRPDPVRALPAAVRERRRRSATPSRCSRPKRRARERAAPTAARRECGASRTVRRRPRLRRACRAIPASTSSATAPAGRCTSASPSRSAAARAHISRRRRSAPRGPQHAEIVDYRATCSRARRADRREPADQGAAPTGQRRASTAVEDRLVLHPLPPRHRLPGARGRRRRPRPVTRSTSARCAAAAGSSELVEQLESLFAPAPLRPQAGRAVITPSAYGQMGRCLSPCLGDLDPNALPPPARRGARDVPGDADGRDRLLGHVERQMRAAAAERALRAGGRAASPARAPADDPRSGRRRARLRRTSGRGSFWRRIRRPPRFDALWLAGGRLVDFGEVPDGRSMSSNAAPASALARAGRNGELGAHVPPDEIDELRIIAAYLESHPELPQLPLTMPPSAASLAAFVAGRRARAATGGQARGVTQAPGRRSAERDRDDLGPDGRAERDDGAVRGLAPDEGERDRAEARQTRRRSSPSRRPGPRR